MPLMVTRCFGVVMLLAATTQAQGQNSGQTGKADEQTAQKLYHQVVGNLDAQYTNPILLNSLEPQQQLSYFIYQGNQDASSGLTVTPIDEATRAHLKVPKGQGLLVTSVLPQGPAAQVGVLQNDILLTLDDVSLAKPEDLEKCLKDAGDKVLKLVLIHRGHKRALRVQPKIRVIFGPVQPAAPELWIGVSVTPLEPALRAQLQIPGNQGLIINSVVDDSPAAKAGFKVNDILLAIGGKHLVEPTELVTLVQKNGEKPLSVEIISEGSRKTIDVTPERRKDLKLLTARVQHAGDWNIVGPGVVVRETPLNYTTLDAIQDLTVANSNAFKPIAVQPDGDAVAKRLDTMAAELKDLRKAVDELTKALKERK